MRMLRSGGIVVLVALGTLCAGASSASAQGEPARATSVAAVAPLTLPEIIEYGLRHNPGVRQSAFGVQVAGQGLKAARGERMPRVDLTSGATAYRYPTPVTPITGSPLSGAPFPDFDDNIYDFGFLFSLPLYKGGRLDRGAEVARIKQLIAGHQLEATRQELAYNLTSTYYKILQLKALARVSDAQVKELEGLRGQAESFVKAGGRAPLDLLKADVELARGRENALVVSNSLQTTLELLKKLMGIEDVTRRIDVAEEQISEKPYLPLDDDLRRAFERRPEYRAVQGRVQAAGEQVKISEGRRLPSVYATADYGRRSGDSLAFKENWSAGVRLTLPVFDGGVIRSDIETQRLELERAKEEERAVRLSINREVKDAYTELENAARRLEVTGMALVPARENRRIELLKYQTGAGTMTDNLDAQTVLLRAEYDYYRALFDRETAYAAMKKALGEDVSEEGVSR